MIGTFGGKPCECPVRDAVCTDTRRETREKRYWFICLACKSTWQALVKLEDRDLSPQMPETETESESEVTDGG